MKGIIVINQFLSRPKFSNLYSAYLQAFQKNKIKVDIMNNMQICIGDYKYPKYDFALFLDKDINLARHLENNNIRVFNSSSAIEVCDDKGKTALALEGSGIVMPKTFLSPFVFNNQDKIEYDFLDNIIKELKYPLVLKEAKGSFGEQVYLVDNREQIIKIIEKKKNISSFVFQEYIKESAGKDIRLQVVGGEVVAAVKRIGAEGDFRANVTLGGKMFKYEPTMREIAAAISATQRLGVEIASVDFLKTKKQIYLCEVNSNAYTTTISKTTGIDVSDKVVKYIFNQIG